MPALGVSADVYDIAPQFIRAGTSIEYTIGAGSHGRIDDAYWDVSILPVIVSGGGFPPGAVLVITRKWFAMDVDGNRSLHYVVSNQSHIPPAPPPGYGHYFVRRLVRIPAR
jgi:hypothetical protein